MKYIADDKRQPMGSACIGLRVHSMRFPSPSLAVGQLNLQHGGRVKLDEVWMKRRRFLSCYEAA